MKENKQNVNYHEQIAHQHSSRSNSVSICSKGHKISDPRGPDP